MLGASATIPSIPNLNSRSTSHQQVQREVEGRSVNKSTKDTLKDKCIGIISVGRTVLQTNFLFAYTRDSVASNKKVLQNVFKYMDLKEILKCRQISRRWNDLICNRESSILWTHTRLFFPKRKFRWATEITSFSDQPRISVNPLESHLEKFSSNQLIQSYRAPNYRFIKIDLNNRKVQQFFELNGKNIKELLFECCPTSWKSLKSILSNCSRIEELELIGMHEFISSSDIAQELDEEFVQFQLIESLKKLTIEPRNCGKHKTYGSILSPPSEKPVGDLAKAVQPSQSFLKTLISSTDYLQVIQLRFVSFKTVFDLLVILGHSEQDLSQLISLQFRDVTTPIKPFFLLDATKNLKKQKLKIQKLELSFVKSVQALSEDQQKDEWDQFQFYNYAVRTFLKRIGSELDEVRFSYLRITREAFTPVGSTSLKLPKLKRLELYGTSMSEWDDYEEIKESFPQVKFLVIKNEVPLNIKPFVLKYIKVPVVPVKFPQTNFEPNYFGFMNYTSFDKLCTIILLAYLVYTIINIADGIGGIIGFTIGCFFGIMLILIFEKCRRNALNLYQ